MIATSLNLNHTVPRTFTSSNHELETRKNALIQKIRTFENRLGKTTTPSDIQIGKFEISAYADPLKNSVNIPSWFLINYDEVPARFRLSNLQDPRLNDNQFLNELSTWMETKIKELGVPAENATIDKDVLKFVIRLMQDRNGLEKAKEFALAHETAHLCHDLKSTVTLNYFLSWAPLVSAIIAVTVSLALLPYVSFAIAMGAGSAIVLAGTLPVFLWNISQFSFWKEEEKKADLDGVKALQGDAQGGIHFFQSVRLHQLLQKAEALSAIANREEGNPPRYAIHGPEFNLCDPIGTVKNYITWFKNAQRWTSIDNDGNNAGDFWHPSLKERIAYLNAQPQRA